MQRSLYLILALVLLQGTMLAQPKKRRSQSGRPKPTPALPTVLNRKTALWMLERAVLFLDDGVRYRSARISAPFTHYRTTPAKLREDQWVRAAERIGWATLSEGRSADPYFPGATTTVQFTAEGTRLFDGATPGYSCEGGTMQYCTFRVAELQAQSITAIRQTASTEAQVLYVWVYQPLPALRAVGVAPEAWSAAATFARFDDGWRITRLGL